MKEKKKKTREKEQPVNTNEKLVNRVTVKRYRRDFSVFFRPYFFFFFCRMFYFSFSPLYLFFFFFSSLSLSLFFFVTATNCLAHIGQPIIRASNFEILENERPVSPTRYRLIIIIVISRRGINHTHFVTEKNCELHRGHGLACPARNGGEFERRRGKESNKHRLGRKMHTKKR